MTRTIKIAPSILSADFGRLAEQVAAVEAAGADVIHIDVMDGHFVPNLTFGMIAVEAVKKATSLPLDVHLMIDNPEAFIDRFAAAGADMISVHVEATAHLHRLIQAIKAQGVKAGAAINPATPVQHLEPILGDLDFALIMSVNPGFGGQKFIPSALEKVSMLRAMIDDRGFNAEIEIDGGVGPDNVDAVVGAGAKILVAGSAVFGAPDYAAAISALKRPSAI